MLCKIPIRVYCILLNFKYFKLDAFFSRESNSYFKGKKSDYSSCHTTEISPTYCCNNSPLLYAKYQIDTYALGRLINEVEE